MTLDDARDHIGESVAYAPSHGNREYGVITEVRARTVFVLYAGDTSAKATDPADLTPLAATASSGMLRWCAGCRIYWMDYTSDPESDEYEPHGCKTAATAGEDPR